MKLLRIISIFLLFSAFSYSQEKDLTYDKCIMLSLKSGYHSGYRLQTSNGFPDGVVYDAAVEFGINRWLITGVGYEFWMRYKVPVKEYGSRDTYNKDFTGSGLRFYIQARKSVYNIASLYMELGVGKYNTTYNYSFNGWLNSGGENYLMAFAGFGADVIITKRIYITGEFTMYGLGNWDESAKLYNFKIGPTYLFRY